MHLFALVMQRQARRVYEMLRLRVTNQNDQKEMKEYRIDVKRRLNIPYQVSKYLFALAFIA